MVGTSMTYATTFLSTPSVGRATRAGGFGNLGKADFYPRPPWGGRRRQPGQSWSADKISIHALRGEGDLYNTDQMRNRTISIHALRGDGDRNLSSIDMSFMAISIHALRGEGDSSIRKMTDLRIFISIHALRGEGDRCRMPIRRRPPRISIHALRGEGDMAHFICA